jgi:hypothetical protein
MGGSEERPYVSPFRPAHRFTRWLESDEPGDSVPFCSPFLISQEHLLEERETLPDLAQFLFQACDLLLMTVEPSLLNQALSETRLLIQDIVRSPTNTAAFSLGRKPATRWMSASTPPAEVPMTMMSCFGTLFAIP